MARRQFLKTLLLRAGRMDSQVKCMNENISPWRCLAASFNCHQQQHLWPRSLALLKQKINFYQWISFMAHNFDFSVYHRVSPTDKTWNIYDLVLLLLHLLFFFPCPRPAIGTHNSWYSFHNRIITDNIPFIHLRSTPQPSSSKTIPLRNGNRFTTHLPLILWSYIYVAVKVQPNVHFFLYSQSTS